MGDELYLSIVIPAYNEEERLPKTLIKIKEFFNQRDIRYEIIVVDDGSRDSTVKKVQDLLNEDVKRQSLIIKNEKNMGKGFSIKRGVLASNGRFVLFCDADGSTPIEEIDKLLTQIKSGYDIAIGSRALKQSEIKVRQPFYREYMGKTFNKLIKTFIFGGINDTQCGFKCFKKEVAHDIFKRQKINRFSFDVEILYIARKLGYKIAEVPVIWLNSADSRVTLINDSTRMFIDILRIPIIHHRL